MTAALVGACVLGANCGSVGTGQVPIQARPIPIVDAKSQRPIPRVLVIPKYSSSTGVSTGAGHGPGFMVGGFFLSFPFLYAPHQLFEPVVPDSTGVLVGPLVFAGRGITLHGVVFFARGYEPRYLWELVHRPIDLKVLMEPVAPDQQAAHTERWKSLLAQDRIRGSDLTEDERQSLSLTSDSTLALRFAARDWKLVHDFWSAK